MTELTKITQEELKDKRLTGLDDTPALSYVAMQARFDAHPDRNTEVINENARIQDLNNQEALKRMDGFDKLFLKKQDSEEGKGLSSNDFTDAEKEKLRRIEDDANRYDDTLLREKIGLLNQAVAEDKKAISQKVDKKEGMGLSERSFTEKEKLKLMGISEGANKYELPAADKISLGGVKIGEGLDISPDGKIDAKTVFYPSPGQHVYDAKEGTLYIMVSPDGSYYAMMADHFEINPSTGLMKPVWKHVAYKEEVDKKLKELKVPEANAAVAGVVKVIPMQRDIDTTVDVYIDSATGKLFVDVFDIAAHL